MDTFTLIAIAVTAAALLFLAYSKGWLSAAESGAAGAALAGLLTLWQRLTGRSDQQSGGSDSVSQQVEEQTEQQVQEIENEQEEQTEQMADGSRDDLADTANSYIDDLRAEQDRK